MTKSTEVNHNAKTACEDANAYLPSATPIERVEKGTGAFSSYLFIKCNNWLEKLKYNTICYLEASGSYCSIHISNNRNLTIAQPLGDIINSLPADTFIRVHRSYVINIEYVNKYYGNIFYIKDTIIPIGRTYKKEALSHFNIVIKGK